VGDELARAGAMIYWTEHFETALQNHTLRQLLEELNQQMVDQKALQEKYPEKDEDSMNTALAQQSDTTVEGNQRRSRDER
jgi:hypothetical protein